jgi:hypothetical protein
MKILLLSLLSTVAFAQTPSTAPVTAASSAGATQLAAQPMDQASTDWKPARTWAGDLRFRLRDQKQATNDARIFEVLRARLAYRADIEQNLTGVLRLATATSAISANQTLGDSSAPGMQRRAFGLDLAYLEYRPCAETTAWLGKTPNPFYAPAKVQMIFDADIDFEGVSAKLVKDFGALSTFVNLGSSLVSENFAAPNDIPDVALLGAQIGAGYKAFGTWTVNASYYTWDNAQGRTPAQIAGGALSGGRYFGNTTDGTTLASKFNIIEAGLDWQHPWGLVTTELFYDWSKNLDANMGSMSNEAGAIAKYGDFQLGAAYVLKEADSQLGAFTDSDTTGGGVDTIGTRANLTWNATKNFALTLSRYDGKRGLSTASPTDFSETMFDIMGSF